MAIITIIQGTAAVSDSRNTINTNFANLNADKIEALADDATPQLGGTLDINGQTIQGSIIPNSPGVDNIGSASSAYVFAYVSSIRSDIIGVETQAGDEIARFETAASPVNYLNVRNSATGNALPITAVGTDANIGINLVPKGTGTVQANGVAIQTEPAEGGFADGDKTKLDYLTVTQTVNLDQMETDIAALANGMVYKGDWDASAGTFPGGGTAQIGAFYYVSVAGTVDGVAFSIGDNIVAIVDNASTTTYAANWSKHDQTDAVQAVVGLVGSISKASLLTALNVEDGADVTDTANVTAAGALMDSEVTNLADVKAFNPADYAPAAHTSDVDAHDAGINAQTGTTYTLALSDIRKLVTMNNASANTLTVPPNSTVAFPIGTKILVTQLGAGSTTIAAGGGVTINAPASVPLEIGEQYGSRGIQKILTDTWVLI